MADPSGGDDVFGPGLQDWKTETERTLQRAGRARSEVEQRRQADAVIALFSCRLAAVEHVLVPAGRRVRSAGEAVRTVLARARESEHVLRLLEQQLNGDLHFAAASRDDLLREVARCLGTYAEAEREMHVALASALDTDGAVALARRFEAAARTAPTRPHPHGPHRGPLERAAYRLHRLEDRVRDAFDSRPLPHPVPPKAPKGGLWAAYALGQPLDRSSAPVPGAVHRTPDGGLTRDVDTAG